VRIQVWELGWRRVFCKKISKCKVLNHDLCHFSQLFTTVTKELRKQLQGRKIYFGSWYKRFQSMFSWLHCFFAFSKAETPWWRKAVYLMAAKRQ
jgi:hypothetical protein